MPDQHDPKESAPAPGQPPIGQDEFARLLAASSEASQHARGQTVRGTIVQIGDTDVLVDVGGKSEAAIARSELASPDGTFSHKVGDPVEATVVSTEGGLRLSRRMTPAGRQKDAVREMLMEAHKSRMPVQGRVTASIKGGYEVHVAGVRGFCPFSQIDVRRQEDPTLYFNKTFDFIVKDYEPRKRNLILSRRALIEAEARQHEAEFRAGLQEGAVVRGTIASIQDFGAFVELGPGVQGLLHVSEISHARVENPRDVLSVGQALDVQVLRLDKKKGKVSLTRKPLEDDPWAGVERRFSEGQVLTARVVRVTEFGAFLELAPGLDGLLHISELSASRGRKGGDSQAAVRAGEEMKVQVLKVDGARRRIGLGLAAEATEVGAKVSTAPPKVGDVVTGKVEKVEKFGVFLRIGPGRTGMIPNSELGTARGSDHRKMFPAGSEITAEVIEADQAGRKIRLSVTKAEGREERAAVDRYRKDVSRSGSGSFSTLADAFNALKKSR
ncbi:MAG TPA: S1 RNA-binding domain-containing protein [Candidatus Polarisedimenticolia bacterium]|nr:S1 RNA-binding domain-containing protein [Candidatus Polarisedimenticolia bacterium]